LFQLPQGAFVPYKLNTLDLTGRPNELFSFEMEKLRQLKGCPLMIILFNYNILKCGEVPASTVTNY
jgi:hypothetical protein